MLNPVYAGGAALAVRKLNNLRDKLGCVRCTGQEPRFAPDELGAKIGADFNGLCYCVVTSRCSFGAKRRRRYECRKIFGATLDSRGPYLSRWTVLFVSHQQMYLATAAAKFPIDGNEYLQLSFHMLHLGRVDSFHFVARAALSFERLHWVRSC
jgi:hypothetical protein